MSNTPPAVLQPFERERSDLVFNSIRKRWRLALVVAVATVLAVAFFTIGQRRIYRATATVQIDPNPARPLGNNIQSVVDLGAGSYWTNKEYFTTQQAILKGRSVAMETARILGLQYDSAFIGNIPPGGESPPKSKRAPTLSDATDVLLGRLSVDAVRESRLVIVNFDDANPERAQRILRTLVDTYLARNVDMAVSSTGAATEWLRSQTETLRTELEKSELALHDYKKEKRILSVSLDDQSNLLRGEMQQLNEVLTRTRARREDLMARVNQLKTVDASDPTTLPATELLSSGILSNLRMDYAQAKGVRDSLLGAGRGDKHPEVEAANAKVEATRVALMTEVENVQGALRGELAAATKEENGLSGLFERAKQRALDLNMLEIEYRRLERAKQNTEKLFGLVLERSKESDLTGMLRFNNISIAEPPVADAVPIRPRVPLNLALGLVAGLALGLGAAFSREWLDQTIRTPDDLEDVIGVPLLGLLPSLGGKVSASAYYSSYARRSRSRNSTVDRNLATDIPPELIAHALPASNAAECSRGIRTSLTLASPDKPYKTILVTSANPSEGKTTVATTIAIAFSQAGQRVLIIDCDLRRSRLHRVFKHRNTIGVTSVLQDPSRIDEACLTTEVPNLSLLAAGPHVPNPAEVLQSESFAKLLEALSKKFDRIVVDSPPVLVVTDAAVLASMADATVLVTRARKTKRETARKVLRKLTDLGAVVAGAVLNALEEPKRKGGYYYGYYSREGYGTRGEADTGAAGSVGT